MELHLDLVGVESQIIISMNNFQEEYILFELIEANSIERLIEEIEKGANLDIKNNAFKTPLQVAVQLNLPELVKVLIEAGAKVESPRLIGQLAELVTDRIDEFPVEVLEILVEAGLDINHPEEDEDTLLMDATMEDNLALVKKLVELGADPNRLNRYGEFALLSTRNKPEIYKYLYPITDSTLRKRIPWKFTWTFD